MIVGAATIINACKKAFVKDILKIIQSKIIPNLLLFEDIWIFWIPLFLSQSSDVTSISFLTYSEIFPISSLE